MTPGSTRRPRRPSRTLRAGYRQCARLTWQHGTTYYWGAILLPPRQRRDVYAVYALCRLADDIVDGPGADQTPESLDRFAAEFLTALRQDDHEDPVLQAVAHTVRTRQINLECFERFFAAMRLDLTQASWPTWPALRDGYMEGSAAVIGEMMLPVLEPISSAAYAPARSLGLAFQLTNFIRDVDEDLDRGRVYLPADDLARHGADPSLRRVTPAWKAFLAEQIARNRELYREAEIGLTVLPPASARCVGTALVLYEQILDRIEAADYDVFSARVRVPTWRKLIMAVRVGLRRRPSKIITAASADRATRSGASQEVAR